MATEIIDNPIERKNITQLTTDQLEAFLDGIRERRLDPVRLYKEALAQKKEVSDMKAKEKLDKQLAMLEKEIASLDKAIEKVEKRVNNVRALRLELNLE